MSTAILLAAGSSTRAGGDVAKQYRSLGGVPVPLRCLDALSGAGVRHFVTVISEECPSELRRQLEEIGSVVLGGPTRNASTLAGLQALVGTGGDDKVLVHDAARPLVRTQTIEEVISALDNCDVVDTYVPIVDTVIERSEGTLSGFLDRDRLGLGHTPQGFRLQLLREAYALESQHGHLEHSDDCSIVHKWFPDKRIALVKSSTDNIKLTENADFVLAEQLLFDRAYESLAIPKVHGMARDGIVVVHGGSGAVGGEIVSRLGSEGHKVESAGSDVDLRSHESLEKFYATLRESQKRIGAVVNASGMVHFSPVSAATPEGMSGLFDIHVQGLLNLCSVIEPYLAATNGVFVNIGSSVSRFPRPGQVAYRASKAAQESILVGVSMEWGERGIRVVNIAPSRILSSSRNQALSSGLVRTGPSHAAVNGPYLSPQEVAGRVAIALELGEPLALDHVRVSEAR